MRTSFWVHATGVLTMMLTLTAHAGPIGFKEGTMAVADFRDGAMLEVQLFYAPTQNFSFGLTHAELDADQTDVRHTVSFARLNVLAKRWNLEAAQANVFLWGGFGSAYIAGWTYDPSGPPPPVTHGHGRPVSAASPIVDSQTSFAYNVGGQIDYETRRIYVSFNTDLQDSSLFSHRADTLQLGFAPYEHDINTLATWFLVSGRNYSGNMHEDTEVALLLRFFKKRAWWEVGSTLEGRIQAMAMFSF